MAFGIEAWWDERQERAEEVEILVGLDEEFVAYRSTLEGVLAQHQNMLSAVEQLLDASQRGGWDPADGQADQALLYLLMPPTIDLGRGVRDALVSSGRLESLSDPDLPIKLASWEGVFDEVVDSELGSRQFVYDQIIPYLARRGIPLSQALSLDIGGWPVPTELLADDPAVRRALFADDEFETLLQTRYWMLAHTTGEYEAALNAIDAIISMIESSLVH